MSVISCQGKDMKNTMDRINKSVCACCCRHLQYHSECNLQLPLLPARAETCSNDNQVQEKIAETAQCNLLLIRKENTDRSSNRSMLYVEKAKRCNNLLLYMAFPSFCRGCDFTADFKMKRFWIYSLTFHGLCKRLAVTAC